VSLRVTPLGNSPGPDGEQRTDRLAEALAEIIVEMAGEGIDVLDVSQDALRGCSRRRKFESLKKALNG
jgi:hypothetical protein